MSDRTPFARVDALLAELESLIPDLSPREAALLAVALQRTRDLAELPTPSALAAEWPRWTPRPWRT